jgi:hypothetical protein
MHSRPQEGVILLLVLVLAAVAMACVAAFAIAAAGAGREQASERALAQAREALLAYAADRPIDSRVGPGYLPCPDIDDDGWAEATCGSLSGDVGQAQRLGRLPWKTLGLPDLRDGHGERLWYAVSSRHKGLLNCAASRGCVDMSPPMALGTITVRGASGEVLHDGTLAGPSLLVDMGAAAVVFAPGPPILRGDGHAQRRDCAVGDCREPRNYLDATPFEDNAAFHDRNDAAGRVGNTDGFVAGPASVDGAIAVNDRLAVLTYDDVMARVKHRIALELTLCLRGLPELPAPDDPCMPGTSLGRVPDAALVSPACNASADESGWWARWKPHVLYARAARPGLSVSDAQGHVSATERRFALLVTQRAGTCEAAIDCGPDGCTHAIAPPRGAGRHDALVASR